ncbi:MAG: HD domain-containing protein [Candidatus Kerfeldbacteria bacterium]
MNYERINQAIEYASEMHHDLRYKYNDNKFQVAHIFFVGAILMKHGFDDDVIIAGFLHDAIEDTDVTKEDIEKRFGKRVADFVEAETVDQTIEWKKRQYLMQDNVRNASLEVKAIKTADQLHQLNLFTDDSHLASQNNYINQKGAKKAYWKYEQLLEAIGTGWSHPILDDAYVLLKKMKKKYL